VAEGSGEAGEGDGGGGSEIAKHHSVSKIASTPLYKHYSLKLYFLIKRNARAMSGLIMACFSFRVVQDEIPRKTDFMKADLRPAEICMTLIHALISLDSCLESCTPERKQK
jgi:hypothetical protein